MARSGSFLRNNSLGLVVIAAFLALWFGQSVVGHHAYNADQRDHKESVVTYGHYLTSGHFREATFENWESEFLQMGGFVLLTVCLRQKGSPESKSLDGGDDVDESPDAHRDDPDAPWPVRRGGVTLKLYRNSLSLAFLLAFLLSWLLHAQGGAVDYSQDQLAHGGQVVTMWQFMTTSEFWFQSLENWQSEFLAVGALVLASIYLRQKGSPESKPVHAPSKEKTGA